MLRSIIAVVIGGTSLAGGSGFIPADHSVYQMQRFSLCRGLARKESAAPTCREFCRKLPKSLVEFDVRLGGGEWPRTGSGKIIRYKLREALKA
jgi:hypothetical protein